MLRSELLELIANGENSGIEFKRDELRPEQLAKEIVAMANLQGGKLLIGVEDDGDVSGISRPDLETWVMDTVFGHYVHPQILPYYEEIAFDEETRVAVISLTQGTSKPYVVRHNGREDVYIRVGSTSRLASREQQARLFESGGLLHAETLPVSGSRFGDLDPGRLIDYLINLAGDEHAPQSSSEWEKRLTGLGIVHARQNGDLVCTIAGLLLFGRNPRLTCHQAGIRWMSFDSRTIEYQAQDDTILTGPMVALRYGKGSRPLIEGGLVERLIDRMQPFISIQEAPSGAEFGRQRRWFYPLEVIREAVLNALIHRDWTRALQVEVVNYADRLEITSPGTLHDSMTIAKMLAGQRSPRNPILMEIMRDYGYSDTRGMGVRQKIVPLTREFSGKDALFDLTDDYLRVVIPRAE